MVVGSVLFITETGRFCKGDKEGGKNSGRLWKRAGSCWEGVDFPGDMVSSLIIVKLPFAVPDPISEAQKKEYASLKDYIQAVIVPDMQKKLRQGFGRALRTETDTCVVSILDERAGEGGRYHEEVMCALPSCKLAKDIKDVQHFIRNRKGVEYYL